MPGFWERAESWLLDLQKDRARAARYFLIAYWISLGVVILGGILIVLGLMGVWPP